MNKNIIVSIAGIRKQILNTETTESISDFFNFVDIDDVGIDHYERMFAILLKYNTKTLRIVVYGRYIGDLQPIEKENIIRNFNFMSKSMEDVIDYTAEHNPNFSGDMDDIAKEFGHLICDDMK